MLRITVTVALVDHLGLERSPVCTAHTIDRDVLYKDNWTTEGKLAFLSGEALSGAINSINRVTVEPMRRCQCCGQEVKT